MADQEIQNTVIGESSGPSSYEFVLQSELYSVTTDSEENISSKKLPPRGRKRKHPCQSRQDKKRRLNSNQTYFNSRGVEILPKVFDAQFQCPCKKRCTDIIPVDARRKFFDDFWGTGSFAGRCSIIIDHVREMPKKRCYTRSNNPRRSKTRKYSIADTDVCKIAFLKTLQITQQRVDTALGKRDMECIADCRGLKSGGRSKHPQSKIQQVTEHIGSFPKHIAANEMDAKFPNVEINLNRMYAMYKAECEEPVSLSSFKSIFYSRFKFILKPSPEDTNLKKDTFQENKGLREDAQLPQFNNNYNKPAKSSSSDIVQSHVYLHSNEGGKIESVIRKSKHSRDQTRQDEAQQLNSNFNQKYFNRKGVEVLPKVFDMEFQCPCKRRCTDVVTIDERKRFFTNYWGTGSFAGRCNVINMHVTEMPKKRCYSKSSQKFRSTTRKYMFGDIEVCKVAFLKTLQIAQQRVDTALKKKHMEIVADGRGLKSGSRKAINKV